MMTDIFKSASKIVLLGLSGTLIISVLFAVFTSKADFGLVMKLFESAVLLVLGYYFGKAEKNVGKK